MSTRPATTELPLAEKADGFCRLAVCYRHAKPPPMRPERTSAVREWGKHWSTQVSDRSGWRLVMDQKESGPTGATLRSVTLAS